MIKKLRNQPCAPKWEQEEGKKYISTGEVASNVKNIIFLDITPCRPVEVNQCISPASIFRVEE
jgi:hypothetical protein